jgi:nucleoside-diphosphate-sugar epimerase
MNSAAQRCAVTGSAGYLGSRIADYFSKQGWSIFELSRRPNANPVQGRIHVPFQLDSPVEARFFRDNDVRVLIHCAYDFRPVNWEQIRRANVEGSSKLLRAAKEGGVERIIFISSISAFDGCSSLYGKAKLEIEKVATDLGAFVVRSGLVYGTRGSRGMFGSLQQMVAKSAVVPLVGSGNYLQYLVHEDDLCDLLLKITRGEVDFRPAPMVAASPQGWRLRDLLRRLADAQHRRTKLIPLPWRPIWLALKALEVVGIPTNFRSDSVISLVRQNPAPDFSVADQIGYSFREFANSFPGTTKSG